MQTTPSKRDTMRFFGALNCTPLPYAYPHACPRQVETALPKRGGTIIVLGGEHRLRRGELPLPASNPPVLAITFALTVMLALAPAPAPTHPRQRHVALAPSSAQERSSSATGTRRVRSYSWAAT